MILNSLPTTPIIAFTPCDLKGELYSVVSELFLRHCRIGCRNLDSWYYVKHCQLSLTFIKRSNFSLLYFIRLFYMQFVITRCSVVCHMITRNLEQQVSGLCCFEHVYILVVTESLFGRFLHVST